MNKALRKLPLLAAALALCACASLQSQCVRNAWMLCGDNLAVHKNYVYLDDPAFLYDNKTVVERRGEVYGFRLSFFFNPYRHRSARLTAEIRPNRSSRPADAGARPVSCDLALGRELTGGWETFDGAWDSALTVSVSRKKDRVNLGFACRDYQPRWGREDTLALRFSGDAPDSSSLMLLPFATSFHGPLYSFLIGSTLIVSMTALGEVIASNR